MVRGALLVVLSSLVMGVSARGQLVEKYEPVKSSCCLASQAKAMAEQMQDWNQLGRYHNANEALKKQPADAKRVVFMGDSITDMWKLEESFPGKPYVNRGISGQTTAQMLGADVSGRDRREARGGDHSGRDERYRTEHGPGDGDNGGRRFDGHDRTSAKARDPGASAR